ncbi:hypothetical protein O181_007180 [Austropuccinia psidii MF-1]|uniref:Uncharacterized protein n=1 Tax=Austropuccinia psidii MF-1 TaxID=1389203 RepID=A0A9Q3BLW0_9BASI|nr:hypothetical protein [Austropuccinia psidii MF-1]
MSSVHLRNLGIPMNQPEDKEGLFRTRGPGRGRFGHSGGFNDTEGKHTHSTINFPVQQKPQTRGLEGYGSSSSAPPTPQRSFPMEHGQQEVQPSIPLGRTWGKLPEDMSQRDTFQRSYGNHQRMESHQELSSEFKPFRHQQISGQESPFFTIPGSFQEKTRIPGKKQYFFQPKAERVRPNDPEAVGLGEKSKKEPEIVVNTSRISRPTNRNITPTQNEHNVVTPESNLKSDELWLQISQFAEKAQERFSELQESHVRMEKLAASMDKIIKNLQAGHAQLRKPSEETNKRLNQVL